MMSLRSRCISSIRSFPGKRCRRLCPTASFPLHFVPNTVVDRRRSWLVKARAAQRGIYSIFSMTLPPQILLPLLRQSQPHNALRKGRRTLSRPLLSCLPHLKAGCGQHPQVNHHKRPTACQDLVSSLCSAVIDVFL